MNIDNMTARDLMEILNDLWEDFDTVSKPMLLGALCNHFHNADRATQSLQEATTEPQTAQSNNSTHSTTKSLDEPVRAKRAKKPSHKQAVKVRGIIYESAKTACRRLNIKPSAIYQSTYRHNITAEEAIERYLTKHEEGKA